MRKLIFVRGVVFVRGGEILVDDFYALTARCAETSLPKKVVLKCKDAETGKEVEIVINEGASSRAGLEDTTLTIEDK